MAAANARPKQAMSCGGAGSPVTFVEHLSRNRLTPSVWYAGLNIGLSQETSTVTLLASDLVSSPGDYTSWQIKRITEDEAAWAATMLLTCSDTIGVNTIMIRGATPAISASSEVSFTLQDPFAVCP